MKLESKFDINETVWHLSKHHKPIHITCAACGGSGRIVLLDGVDRSCPECYGNGHRSEMAALSWYPSSSMRIGKIEITAINIEKDDVFDNVGDYAEGKTELACQYMCYETGIGSGTVYYEKDLFNNIDDALAECEERNSKEGESE